MLKTIKKITWGIIFLLGSLFLALLFSSSHHQFLIQFQSNQTQLPIEKNLSSALAINPGGATEEKFNNFLSKFRLKKREKFDSAFHRKLKMHFPDWEERIAFQSKQEEFYLQAVKRKRESQKLRLIKVSYTKQELDAIAYFHGIGFYKKQQNPKVRPNIFDTRKSFLLKMHNPVLRHEFLNSFQRQSR